VELHDRVGSDPGVRDDVLAARWLLVLGDHGSAYTRFSALERRCREEGSVGLLPRVLASLAICQQHRGRPYEAAASGEEGLRIAHDSGQYETVGHLTDILGHLAAIAGDEDRCRALLADAADRVVASAYPARAAGALALLDLGRGRYPSALERLRAVVPESGPLDVLSNVPDLVEVAVRLDEPDIAAGPADWFLSWAGASGQPWAEAVAHRCSALLAGTDAEEQYRAALGRHEVDGQRPFERARTQLLYGEWLRRLRRRGEARPHLKAAHLTFEGLGAAPWAERARDELRAAGESLPAARDTDLRSLLTPQEHQVVQLAADGLSNREIGAQLFLSSRTIGYHLYNAFPKLGVTSRTELARLFGENRTSDPVD
jgi:DNA-binding CsgD family transcriptional regulator